jgi:hypothetical protein
LKHEEANSRFRQWWDRKWRAESGEHLSRSFLAVVVAAPVCLKANAINGRVHLKTTYEGRRGEGRGCGSVRTSISTHTHTYTGRGYTHSHTHTGMSFDLVQEGHLGVRNIHLLFALR